MADKELFAERLLGGSKGSEEPRSGATGERQLSALAFSLEVVFKDGRRARGFAMSGYSDYEWTDGGETEQLVLLFGMRAVLIEGELLGDVVALFKEGRLNQIQEMTHREVQQLRQHNPERKPIITRVTVEPDMQLILSAIRGEEDETRNAGRVK